jgi:hypothetical protein
VEVPRAQNHAKADKLKARRIARKENKMNDLETTAANLYDGGWRAANKEELIKEYGFTVDEIEIIIKYLASYEEALRLLAQYWHKHK